MDEPADLPLGSAKTQQLAVWWPVPIHLRLVELVQLANSVGTKTTKRELVAAMVLDATETPAQLERCVRRYRKARVRDAIGSLRRPSN